MNFKEWFDKKLTVGAFPVLVNEGFKFYECDNIINVSDEYYPHIVAHFLSENIKTFWFPMNEKRRDIGLNSIYGAMVILRHAEEANESVYLHCHSGRNRSRIIQACYHFMRSGGHLKDGNEKYVNRLYRASIRGYLPPMAEMEEFLRNIGHKITKMKGGILDDCKIGVINNF